MRDDSLCLGVPKNLGERIRQLLKHASLLDTQREITRDKDLIQFPLLRAPSSQEWRLIRNLTHKAKTISIEPKILHKVRRPHSIVEALSGCMDPSVLEHVKHSFDIVGDIAVIEVPPELAGYKRLIAEAIVKVHKGVKTILSKSGAVDGTFRIRNYEHLLGDLKTETTHKEHGCKYMLDVTKVYFSPRLATERLRVASQTNSNEVVVDMFAGVGPFSILIAKKSGAKVHSIDINPDAIKYLRINCGLNKVERLVSPILGNAREVVSEEFKGAADRVIMNLPYESLEYVDVACLTLRSQGGKVHFYRSEVEPNPIERASVLLRSKIESSGRKLHRIVQGRLVKSVAPHQWQVALDAIID